MSLHFYQQIRATKNFSDISKLEIYSPCPEDWYLFATDVKGSTLAIEEGRQKDVNLVGAAAIAAIQNCTKERDIPFTFGGDGATCLLPPNYYDIVKEELIRLKLHAKALFGLDLRVSAIPIKTIYENQGKVLVSKYALNGDNFIALFAGEGFLIAEKLLKSKSELFELSEKDLKFNLPPDLQNLSCRWESIPAKKGVILSLLVMARDERRSFQIYEEVLTYIKYSENYPSSHTMKSMSFIKQLGYEIKKAGSVFHLKKLVRFLAAYLSMQFALKLNINLFSFFDTKTYLKETFLNSDSKKLDHSLKMIIDCDQAQKENLNDYLNKLYQKGVVYYGIHTSDSSLMTCLVHTDQKHVHFIDGNNGGYALAAKELKKQMAKDQSP